jgi:glycosyltransferase involved in cell wall biosynthesis
MGMNENKLISIVIPVFNEIDVIDACYERLTGVMRSLQGYDYELVFVDDGSRDRSYERLITFHAQDPHLKIVKFSRNFGHQIAVTAGVDEAVGDAIVIIDADLQDPPEVIPEMVRKWEEGYDVVYGVRQRRAGESRIKLLTAAAFYRLLRSFTNIEIPVDVGDFRLISARAAAQLRKLREKDRFVRGLVSWIGFQQIGIPYERDSRLAGETKYPYRKMFKFAIDGITSFSNLPLKVASWLGYMASFLAFVYLASVFVQRAMGYTVEGWATIMVAMLFLGGVQLICIGIIGEYIGRIFNETKSRPMYVIESVHQSAQHTQAGQQLKAGGE